MKTHKTLGIVAAAVGALAVVPSYGAMLSEGSVLPHYAIVSVGPHASIMINSGPVNGAVLVGDGSTTSSSGGGNGAITGGVSTDSAALGTGLSNIQTPPTVTLVSSTVTQQAFTDAASLAAAALALTPTPGYTFTSINGSQTFNAAGAVTVIDVGSMNNPNLTFNGTANDLFVVNISGSYSTNKVNTLEGGVTAANILFNFTGTSGNIFQTSGGDVLQGTFLATDGGDFQFSNLELTGQLINTGGHIQDVSGSGIPQFMSFVPEPASLSVLGLGAMSLILRRRRRA